ncbi:collagen binding domain-containing protein [Lysinibacillus irui]|uniref:collagen binding domain-containing protein n=1 Tax=Lysinibacillus irui TaxID=2998077 RepID=UPI004044DE6D
MKNLKKLNIAIILLLLVFQTVLSPISVFADEIDPATTPPTESSEDVATTTRSSDEGELSPPATSEEEGGNVENGEPSVTPPSAPEEGATDDDTGSSITPPTTSEEDTGDNKEETLPEDGTEGEKAEDVPTGDKNLEEQNPLMEPPLNTTPTDLTETAKLNVFELKINGTDVVPPEFTTELKQDQQVQGKFIFLVDLPGDVKAGDFFTYPLPASLIDFNSAFNGKKDSTPISPAFEWSTSGNLVTVTIKEDPSADIAGSTDVGFEMNFTAGFNLTENSLEQNLVIPTVGDGTDNVKLTFLPSTSDEKMVSKDSKGVTINNGERIIDWEVWINRAGKNLTNATVQDTPSAGHEVVPSSVTLEKFEVGLNGVSATAAETQSNLNFEDITLNGKNAYKITYQTKVNLPIDEQEGQKNFINSLALNDPNHSDSDSKTATTTYGKALEKSKDSSKTSNNYVSSWEVRYNYNQAAIDQADAWIEDTLPTGHVIDTSTIKVYEMTVNDTGTATGAGTEVNAGNYKVDDTATGFKLTFTNDITKAYRITYDAKLPADFYSNSSPETMTNSVISGTVSTARTATHTLTEGILTKSRTVDTDKKEITWSITVKADNGTSAGTDIKGLTIADTFTEGSYNAPHKLVDANNDGIIDAADIKVANMTGQTISIDDNGFTLSNGTVAKGQTAVITYKTAYEILPDGSIYEQGYGNTAAASWTTDKSYSITKTAHYRPESNSLNNGRKQGAYDYIAQVFNWNIKVNINKQNINNAMLADTLGEGHEIVPGTFEIKEFTLTTPNDDEIGTEGAVLDSSLYTLTIAPDNKSFTVTFEDDLGAANNKVYIVKYQTKDSDNIVGIESTTKAEKNKPYTNTAIFTTNVGGSPKVYNLPASSVTPSYTNHLITKGAPGVNSTTERLTWTLDVNRSLSTLGATKVSDVPSENQLLLKDTIKVKKYNVDASTGPSVPGGAWLNPADLGFNVTFPATGGFEIDFGELNKEGYQIQYQTLVLGKADDPYNNEAKIDFGFATAVNQEKEAKYNGNFSFSASDADFSLTKGTLKFNKVGLNSLTGVKKPLPGVEFELVKMVKGTPYIVATATSDADGNVLFEEVNYANYIVREKGAPTGYELMANYAIKLDAKTDTKLAENASKIIELVNNEQIDSTNACPAFTLTVKDIDGNPLANEAIKLVDSNGVEINVGNTNSLGQITSIKRPGTSGSGTNVQAGTYTVKDADDNVLGTIVVKYGQNECHSEIQPINSCPLFTITVKDENNNPRPNVQVTLKDTNNSIVATETTDSNGQFTIDKTTPSGKYKIYEGTQYLGEVNVTYQNGNCQDEVIQAPKCETFELTVKDVDGKLVADDTEVTIKDIDGKTIATAKTKDGKVELKDLEPGTYGVFDEDDNKIGDFSSNINCQAIVQQKPACERFTVELKDNNNILIKAGSDVVIKDKSGNVILTVIEADGSITFASENVPAGKYEVYDNKVYLGEIEVSYKQTCKAELIIAPACPDFTLTINNMYGQPRAGVKVTITGEDGLAVEDNGSTEFTSDNNGHITISNLLVKPGKYTISENGKTIIATIIVGNACESKIQPTPPVTPPTTDPNNPTPEPGQPVDPTPNPDPEKPVDPNKPNPDPDKPVDPNKPNPDPDKPVDPNKPNPDPDKPVDPNKPNPDPDKPVDPNKPNPDPNKPVDPSKPLPDLDKPANPDNQTPGPNSPSTSDNNGTSVQNVIDQGKNLPPYDPSTASKDMLDAYKDFLNNYSKLSKDEQAEVARSIDINKIKADAERLEAQLKAKGKLPQTDGANQTALILIGIVFVLGALFLLRSRKMEFE